jgi:type 1 glutamine amidotransferase
MRKNLIFMVLLTVAGTVLYTGCSKKVSILIIAGGHSFDTIEFFDIFHSLDGIDFDSVYHPEALAWLQSGQADDYSVLVFYDFIPGLAANDSSVFQDLIRQGKPMLFLHHALCTGQNWDGYMKMVGGRYVMPEYHPDSMAWSDYKHDIRLSVEVADQDHPVTRGMGDFTIHDEGYSNITVLPGVTPLLRTDHPHASPLIGWTHTAGQSKIVYLMLGHDKYAYQNPAYRQLLSQSILWLADK